VNQIYADILVYVPAFMNAPFLFMNAYENTCLPLDTTARVHVSDEDKAFPHGLLVTI
jgi:hypothetical protein